MRRTLEALRLKKKQRHQDKTAKKAADQGIIETINCLHCNNIAPKYTLGDFRRPRRFCNLKCYLAYENRGEKITGEDNYWWKGEKAKQAAKHHWIWLHFGKANKCENKNCMGISKSYEWSNKDHKYRRNRLDWQQLCQSCHNHYDYKRFGLRKHFYNGTMQQRFRK